MLYMRMNARGRHAKSPKANKLSFFSTLLLYNVFIATINNKLTLEKQFNSTLLLNDLLPHYVINAQ